MRERLINIHSILIIAVSLIIFNLTATADVPTFYLSPSSNPDGDLAWQSAVGGVHAEFDMEGLSYYTVDNLIADDLIIDVGLGGIPGIAEIARTFGISGPYGTVSSTTLLSYTPSNVRHSQITFEFSEPVIGFGTWVFDDSQSYRESIRMIVTDGNDDVWISDILESGNGYYHAIEGFIGVVSTAGVKKVAIENLNELSLTPRAGAFELDHIQVGGLFQANTPPEADAGDDQSVTV